MATEETRTIVIAMDGSEYAEKAFDWYWSNMRRESDELVLVHVPEFHTVIQSPLEVADITSLTTYYTEEEEMTKELIAKLTTLLRDKNAKGKVKAMRGRPGDVIVKVADEEGADVIITGARGLGTIRRTLIGSISDYVLHHSHVPVVVCKH